MHGNICDAALVKSLIDQYDPDYIINFAAESHVDRSIANPEIFVTTNVMGTVNLLQRAKEAWYDAGQKTWMERVTSGEYQKYYEEMYKNR